MLFQLRSALAYRYFEYRTRGIDRTPPLSSDAASPCEIHTMLGTRDITMYLLAIKSLLLHVPGLSVVVHSDGSLGEAEASRLRRHVTGVKVIDHAAADEAAGRALVDFPLLKQWRLHDAAYRRLVDVEIWRRAPRVIILDSDVITNHHPREVAAWARAGERPFMLGQPAKNPAPPEASSSPPAMAHVQVQFLAQVPELSRILQTKPLFIQGGTAGFCGYLRELSLERTQAALAAALDLGLPMHQWGGDQCLVIYLLSTAGAERLPGDRYLNFDPSVREAADQASIIHFYGTHRFHGLVYPRLAAAAVRTMAAPRQRSLSVV